MRSPPILRGTDASLMARMQSAFAEIRLSVIVVAERREFGFVHGIPGSRLPLALTNCWLSCPVEPLTLRGCRTLCHHPLHLGEKAAGHLARWTPSSPRRPCALGATVVTHTISAEFRRVPHSEGRGLAVTLRTHLFRVCRLHLPTPRRSPASSNASFSSTRKTPNTIADSGLTVPTGSTGSPQAGSGLRRASRPRGKKSASARIRKSHHRRPMPGVVRRDAAPHSPGEWTRHTAARRPIPRRGVQRASCRRAFTASASTSAAASLPGIGKVYAEKIVDVFGADTFRVLSESPRGCGACPASARSAPRPSSTRGTGSAPSASSTFFSRPTA